MKATSKEFCQELRKQAQKIADGEPLEIRMLMLESMLAPEDVRKINASYLRMTLNRTPEIKAVGTVRVTRLDTATEGEGFRVTINREPSRRVITNDDLPALEERWKAKFIKHLLETAPRITDLEGDQLTGAAIALERFAAMLEKMAKSGEE